MKPHFLAALAATTSIMTATLALAAVTRPPLWPTEPAFVRGSPVHLRGEARILAAASPAVAEYTLGALRIGAPWMRATPKGAAVAGGYLTVTNQGDKPDRLVSVESDLATSVEVHEMTMSGGVMSMHPVGKPLEIAPGATLELKPGGYHVMFSGLKQGVKEGDRVKAILVFETAGKIEIEFLAGGLAAKAPATPRM